MSEEYLKLKDIFAPENQRKNQIPGPEIASNLCRVEELEKNDRVKEIDWLGNWRTVPVNEK